MTNEDYKLAGQLCGLSQNQLAAIQEAIKLKDLAFAKILFARLETDLSVLRGLIHKEGKT